MKKYVIMNPLLAGMGGGQMYTRNKALYMESQGWNVDVIYAIKGKILIGELNKYHNIYPEIIFPIHYFPKWKSKKIVQELALVIKDQDYDEIVIESSYTTTSIWAEAVSSIIGAKHIIYLLQEDNTIDHKGIQQFFIYKHQRKELVSITETSLLQMFSLFHPICKDESYWLPAFCNNVEADIESPWIEAVEKCKCDFVIGSLGRLEKPYILPALTDICRYAQLHHEKKMLLLIIGGAPSLDVVINKIKSLVTEIADNVELLFTGYLYPLPIRLLSKCDAFISSAGSSWVCAKTGIPTITYDGNDYRPIGILGRTTNNALFRGETEPIQDFNSLMDQILFKHRYPKLEAACEKELPDFKEHLHFIDGTSSDNNYYDVNLIHSESLKEKILKWNIMLFGPSLYYRFFMFKRAFSL